MISLLFIDINLEGNPDKIAIFEKNMVQDLEFFKHAINKHLM